MEYEISFCELLNVLAHSEREIEVSRQALAADKSFTPASAFSHLDTHNRDLLSTSDLITFFRDRADCTTETQAYRILKQYDSNKDGYLTYEDFTQIFITSDEVMRRVVSERLEKGSVYAGVVDKMLNVLEAEVRLIELVEAAKRQLVESRGFFVLSLFCGIGNGAPITADRLFSYSLNLGFELSENDIYSIFRRMDRDRDGVIGYTEFVDAILPIEVVMGSVQFSPSK